ncbi:hypothetical protein F0562_015728 [Nyssa sinensis]|uniref:Phytocyanin domain-containing protein n=1 Tax=Nyssa sinensis TaxID=561372 RepID=A0A5J4ZK62_9ASTE|nr:hypothetical protein F0562_015728 [Nyssa sinensis]
MDDFDYESWAKDKDFRVGDTLVFKYPAGVHTVFKVDENGYKNCIVPSNNDALTSGKDTVTLDKPGKQYFLCGVGMHCEKAGQKLQVDVNDGSSGNTEDAAAAAPTAAPTSAPSQSTNKAPSPDATESSSTGSPPKVADVGDSSDGAAAPSPTENSSNGLRKIGYQQPLAIMVAIVRAFGCLLIEIENVSNYYLA